MIQLKKLLKAMQCSSGFCVFEQKYFSYFAFFGLCQELLVNKHSFICTSFTTRWQYQLTIHQKDVHVFSYERKILLNKAVSNLLLIRITSWGPEQMTIK